MDPSGYEVNAYIQSQFEFVDADTSGHIVTTSNSPSLIFVMTIDDTATHTKLEVCSLYRALLNQSCDHG